MLFFLCFLFCFFVGGVEGVLGFVLGLRSGLQGLELGLDRCRRRAIKKTCGDRALGYALQTTDHEP